MDRLIDEQGNIQGHLFIKNPQCPYPHPIYNKETYGQYHNRVQKLAEEQGFHKGDLNWNDYDIYCKGSGQYDTGEGIFDENKIIK